MLDELISFHALLEINSGDDEATFVQELHYFFITQLAGLEAIIQREPKDIVRFIVSLDLPHIVYGFVAVAGPHQEPVKTLIGQVHVDPVSVFLGIGLDPSFLAVIIQTKAKIRR
jgi:hypothetical protein